MLFRILVAGEDTEVIQELHNHFARQGGYEIVNADNPEDVLALCRERLPHWIVLDTTIPALASPDDIRKMLFPCTGYTFVLPAEQRDQLMMSPYEIIFKPFQPQELINQIESTLERRYKCGLWHPVTFLPTGRLIEDWMRMLARGTLAWTLVVY